MSAIEIVPSHGSSLPPSKWHLDNVPGLVLDIIVDYLADDATGGLPFGHPIYSDLYGLDPVIIPSSQDLKTMSLVTHRFRENILRRKMIDTVILYTRRMIASALTRIQRGSYGYIRHIIIAEPLTNGVGETLTTFLQRCSSVESIVDQSGKVAYLPHSFTETVSDLRLILLSGKALPEPIDAPGLRQLWVSGTVYHNTERVFSVESIHFTAKVKRLCQNVANLGILNLQPPGLSTSITSKRDRLPSELNMQDPLPETLESIRQLSVVIGVHFCTVDKGQPREAHWWGYYSWIITTAPKIAEIDLIMVWVVDRRLHWSADPYEILASMGLNTLKWDEENNVLKTRPQCERETISPDMKEFILLLLRARPELKMITLSHDIFIPYGEGPSLPFRRVTAVRSEGPGGRESIVFNDRIDYDIVERNVQRTIVLSWDDGSDASDGSMISY